ncbi:MAG TPA: DUF3592 domain-containing protein [Polyangiaceae bacterium]
MLGLLFWIPSEFQILSHLLAPGWRAHAASSWQKTSCTILQASAVLHPQRAGGHDFTSSRLELHYRYSARGRAYDGERFDFNEGSQDGSGAQRIVEQLPIGGTVDCYYDPDSPDRSSLRRSAWAGWGSALAMLTLAIACEALLVFGAVLHTGRQTWLRAACVFTAMVLGGELFFAAALGVSAGWPGLGVLSTALLSLAQGVLVVWLVRR